VGEGGRCTWPMCDRGGWGGESVRVERGEGKKRGMGKRVGARGWGKVRRWGSRCSGNGRGGVGLRVRVVRPAGVGGKLASLDAEGLLMRPGGSATSVPISHLFQ
jgi:hypothetical protein